MCRPGRGRGLGPVGVGSTRASASLGGGVFFGGTSKGRGGPVHGPRSPLPRALTTLPLLLGPGACGRPFPQHKEFSFSALGAAGNTQNQETRQIRLSGRPPRPHRSASSLGGPWTLKPGGRMGQLGVRMRGTPVWAPRAQSPPTAGARVPRETNGQQQPGQAHHLERRGRG